MRYIAARPLTGIGYTTGRSGIWRCVLEAAYRVSPIPVTARNVIATDRRALAMIWTRSRQSVARRRRILGQGLSAVSRCGSDRPQTYEGRRIDCAFVGDIVEPCVSCRRRPISRDILRVLHEIGRISYVARVLILARVRAEQTAVPKPFLRR